MANDSGPILVPLDGSKNSERALPHALRLAELHEASLRVVHVADEGEVRDSSLTEASDVFANYVGDLMGDAASAIAYDSELLLGTPAEMIVNAAAEARFIALASHGRSGFHATFVGSVADKVVRASRAPVLFVPSVGDPTRTRYQRIVVAVDGSPEAEGGLAAARDLAARSGGAITLVQAYSVPPAVGFEFGAASYSANVFETLEEASRSYLGQLAQDGETTITVQSSASNAISVAAERTDADLVVMTSHGKGLATRVALGSTTDRVMHSLHRSLLIVPVG